MCVDPSLLSAYLDHELSFEESRGVEVHLQGCARCRENLARLGRLHELISITRIEPRVESSAALLAFRRRNARRSRHAHLCWMARPMAREVMHVGLSLAAAGVFFVSGLLLSGVGKEDSTSRPLASVTWDVMDNYSPHPAELANFQRKLQTMEASFEVTVPGEFSLPSAFEVGVHAAEQKR